MIIMQNQYCVSVIPPWVRDLQSNDEKIKRCNTNSSNVIQKGKRMRKNELATKIELRSALLKNSILYQIDIPKWLPQKKEQNIKNYWSKREIKIVTIFATK